MSIAISTRTRLGLLYFFFFGALGSLLPFMSLIFSEQGLSPAKIGLLMMLLPASNLVIPPVWGMLADSRSAHIPALVLALVGTAAFTVCLIPSWSFGALALLMVGFSIFRAPVTALLDAITHAHLTGRLEEFGLIRLWGSVGFLFTSGLFGFLRDTLTPSSPLLGTALFLLLGAICALRVPPPPASPVNRSAAGAIRALKRPGIGLFFVTVAIYYCSHATFDAFVSLHLRSLGFSDTFIGAMWSFGVAVEVALMTVAPAILRRLSPERTLILASLAAALRWAILSGAETPFWVLLQQPLHGLTFGLWYLACAGWVQSRAPHDLRATFQSLLISFMGAGMLVGYGVGGSILEHRGGSALYQGAALGSLCAALLYQHLKAQSTPAPKNSPPQCD